ncbi:MAG: hypothetical protein CG439_1403 [Methylococcaceae bacterium NSP1-2]|nr:hypothetical protein [Methylococcaceae bacterium]OYV18099.1 MAG: hypothetical protein CG439_1403 [Methylococcaceae bacterium NSP1-2]
MKINVIILLAATLVSGICHAECGQGAEVANGFLDDYIKYNADVYNQKTQETDLQWIKRNEKLTDNFKKAYKNLVEQAQKQDPELGLGFDPIFDAQDYPDQGFNIVNCEQQSNLVTLAGKNKEWENFKVVLKVINTKKGWRVDGAGVINIPKNKQASR